jgi:hypothetical protein
MGSYLRVLPPRASLATPPERPRHLLVSKPLKCSLQNDGRAADAEGAAVERMGIDHRGAHVAVPQQFLDGTDVLALLQQVGRKGMAEAV